MKKGIKVLVTALTLCFMLSQAAFAEMPKFTVVIGDKAFSLEYINNNSNTQEISSLMNSKEKTYVKLLDGMWIDNENGENIDKSIIPEVTYKNEKGVVTKYSKGDGKEIKEDNSEDILCTININSVKNGIGQAITVDFTDTGRKNIKNGYKFDIIDTSGKQISRSEILGKKTYMYPSKNRGEKFSVRILDYEDREILTFKNIEAELSNTIYVNSKYIQEGKIIEVSNTEELLKNIGSNRTIILKEGKYDLLKNKQVKNSNLYYEEVFDGKQLVIDNVYNLTIKGQKSYNTELLINPRYANVLTFRNSNKITISNVTAGHYPDKGECVGGVFVFDNCSDVNVNDSVLFGCGIEGLNLNYVQDFAFTNSVIKECSNGIMTLNASSNIKFYNSSFYDNKNFYMFNISNCNNIDIDKCKIHNNNTGDYCEYMFNVDFSTNVNIKNSIIKDNKVKDLVDEEDNVIFENVEFVNNSFDNNEKSSKVLSKDEACELLYNKIKNNFKKFNLVYDGIDNIKGKDYFVIKACEEHTDHIATLGWYCVEKDGSEVYKLDIVDQALIPLNQ